MNGIKIRKKRKQICRHAFTFSRKHEIWSFRVVVLPSTGKKCTKMKTYVQSDCFFSLSLLFCGVLVAVAVAVVVA